MSWKFSSYQHSQPFQIKKVIGKILSLDPPEALRLINNGLEKVFEAVTYFADKIIALGRWGIQWAKQIIDRILKGINFNQNNQIE